MMNILALAGISGAAISGAVAYAAMPEDMPASAPAEVAVCFSPEGACGEKIAAAIDGARSNVLVQMMNFSSDQIADALIDAHRRGVRVEVILDDRHQAAVDEDDGCDVIATRIAAAGVPVWIDAGVRTAHNKVAIIDEDLVIGGSYNYTNSAEDRNAENVTFTWSSTVAGWYLDNWLERRDESEPISLPACG